MSGESVVCQRTLTHSSFDYDVCCGPVGAAGDIHVRLLPVGGNKYLSWPLGVLKTFLQMDRQEHYRIMMSRVMPPNGHLAGWLIKRARPDIKWVVYFSDPIWNSPFLKFSLGWNKDHRPNWLLMKVFGIPAKWAVREGDLLVFNNQRLAKYVLGRQYERFRGKVVIAPYGHEGLKPRPAPQRGDGKFRLTHVGQIYGNRSFAGLMAGLEKLQKEEPELFDRLEIQQVGFMCQSEMDRVNASPAASAVTLVGQVPYQESLEEMYQADCLLVIDPVFDDPKKNIYVPGKLYDYMFTGRPILCIAERDSATGDVAGKIGCICAPPEKGAVFSALVNVCKGISPPCDVKQCHCQAGVWRLDRAIEGSLQ